MKNLIALIDAVCDVYDNSDLLPKEGLTYCNLAVNFVAAAMGYGGFAGKNADQMIDLITNSEDWNAVAFEQAQDLANQGSFLVAGLKSVDLKQEHGHIVVIRPGLACYSGKWGKTPRCLNIGKENYLARAKSGVLINSPVGLNDAFIPMPHIFVWKPSLT